MSKVLITGADGFLGSNIVRKFLNEGWDVRAFIHPGRDPVNLEGLQIELFKGDILHLDDVAVAMDGCDYLVHSAASTQLWPSRSSKIRDVNITGTENVMEAALLAGIRKIVYVGTANSFGSGSKDSPGCEQFKRTSGKYGLDYMDTKFQTQQHLLKLVHEKNLPAVIVNPTMMVGRYDSPSGFCAMVMAVYNQKSPGYSSGGRNYIYVKDAATGIFNAMNKGVAGECYILANRNMSYKEIFDEIAEVLGVNPPKRKIPGVLVKAFGLFSSIVSAIRHKPPAVSYPLSRIACDDDYYKADKAIRELDLPQTDIRIAIQESYQWMKENRYFSN